MESPHSLSLTATFECESDCEIKNRVCATRWGWASGWDIERVSECLWAGCLTHSSKQVWSQDFAQLSNKHILKHSMFSFSINATRIIDCSECDVLLPLPTCFLASCLSWSTVSALISPSPYYPLPLFFLSTVCSCLLCGMIFINLATMTVCSSRNLWESSDDILVPRSDMSVSERKERFVTVLYVSVLQVWCVWSLARLLWSS